MSEPRCSPPVTTQERALGCRVVNRLIETAGEITDTFQHWRALDRQTVNAAQMRPCTRPGPVPGAGYKPRTDRIEGDMAHCIDQMALGHVDGNLAALPQTPVVRARALMNPV